MFTSADILARQEGKKFMTVLVYHGNNTDSVDSDPLCSHSLSSTNSADKVSYYIMLLL